MNGSLSTLRVHPAMNVLQVKLLLQASDPSGIDAATISVHMDSVGELSDFITLGEYGIKHDNASSPLLIFFHPSSSSSSQSKPFPQHLAFDFDEVHTEELFLLSLVFANRPPVKIAAPPPPVSPPPPEEEEDNERRDEEDREEEEFNDEENDSARRQQQRQREAASASRDIPHLNTHSASESDSASHRSIPGTSSSRLISTRGGGGIDGGSGGGNNGGDGGKSRPETSDTSRKFLEDDGDIASQSSLDEQEIAERNIEARFAAMNTEQQQYHSQQQQFQQQQQAALDINPVTASAMPKPGTGGGIKGELLDGYRMLMAAKVDLPEEVTRLVLTGCNPMLVDAVPEHLAEFINLAYLDVSGNCLPLDRFRLLPALDELNLSCNQVRELDFSPIPGIHYPADTADPSQFAPFHIEDMIGFPQLTRLDLSYNYISQSAIHVLSVLPKLNTLSLAANDLVHLPLDLSNFWKLSKLSLKNNRLGSGSLGAKVKRVRDFGGILHHSSAVDGNFTGKFKKQTRPLSAMSEASHTGLEDPSEKERKLFEALSTLPNLVELDLSENLITCVPAGCIPDDPHSFPQLQFLNLALNQFETEQSVLPLGDIPHLKWLDLRSNPFLTNHRLARERYHKPNPVKINYAEAFPDLFHVLCENCHVSVVMAKPRNNNQQLQQDLSHILRAPPSIAAASSSSSSTFQTHQSFSGRMNSLNPVESEAEGHRSRVSSAKINRSLAGENERLRLKQQQRAIEEKETFGFSTAHEFESEADRARRPKDSLEQFILGQQQLVSSKSPSNKNHNRRGSQEEEDMYSNQYDAYSSTFLTGITVEDLKQTPVFQQDLTDGTAHHITTANTVHYPAKQLLSKKRALHASAALRSLLAQSSTSVTQMSKPQTRVETIPVKVGSSPAKRHPHNTKPLTGIFGVRQPKVAKVYKQMEEVLDNIESTYGASASAAASSRAAAGGVRKTGASSQYVDPVHERTMNRVRATRQLEREKQDVNVLLQTVTEVSKTLL